MNLSKGTARWLFQFHTTINPCSRDLATLINYLSFPLSFLYGKYSMFTIFSFRSLRKMSDPHLLKIIYVVASVDGLWINYIQVRVNNILYFRSGILIDCSISPLYQTRKLGTWLYDGIDCSISTIPHSWNKITLDDGFKQ